MATLAVGDEPEAIDPRGGLAIHAGHPTPPPGEIPYAGRVTEPTRAFSWKQGLLHALIPLAFVMLVGGLLSGLGQVADPFRFGQGLGRASFFLMLVALGLSYLAQTGRRRLARVLAITLTVAVVGATIVGLVALLATHRAGAANL